MLILTTIFFLLAAALGLVLLYAFLQGKPSYKPLVFMHGSVAGVALFTMVSYIALGHVAPILLVSFILFVLAALGGLTLFVCDISHKPLPKMIAMLHPLLATISLTLLIVYVLVG